MYDFAHLLHADFETPFHTSRFSVPDLDLPCFVWHARHAWSSFSFFFFRKEEQSSEKLTFLLRYLTPFLLLIYKIFFKW